MKLVACNRLFSVVKCELVVPSDRIVSLLTLSLAHRAYGKVVIKNIAKVREVSLMLVALNLLGCRIECVDDMVIVNGVGCLYKPIDVLYVGNSMLLTSIMIGLVSVYDFNSIIVGGSQLDSCEYLVNNMKAVGARFTSNNIPLSVRCQGSAMPLECRDGNLYVRIAAILAGLNASGYTSIIDVGDSSGIEFSLKEIGVMPSRLSNVSGVGKCNAISVNGPVEISECVCSIPYSTELLAIEVSFVIIANKKIAETDSVLVDKVQSIAKCFGIEFFPQTTCNITNMGQVLDFYPVFIVLAVLLHNEVTCNDLRLLLPKQVWRLHQVLSALAAIGCSTEYSADRLKIIRIPDKVLLVNEMKLCFTEHDHALGVALMLIGLIAGENFSVELLGDVDYDVKQLMYWMSSHKFLEIILV